MRSWIAVVLFLTPVVLGILQWREKGYLRLPYNQAGQFGMLRNGATKATYHPQTRMLYVIGTGTNLMHIVDLTNTDQPRIAYTHFFNAVGDGEITDVVSCPDSVAVSIVNNDKTSEGHVEVFLPFTANDQTITRLGRITVGVYPKSMAFTPDCSRLVVVNEGKPGIRVNTGRFYDPEGSISIIVRNDAGFPPEINLNFQSFNNRVLEYVVKGVRYIFRGDTAAGIQSTFSQDLEPESVVIDNNGRYAYISLQENNAIVKLDLTTNMYIDIYPLGVKNFSNFDMDASDRDGGANLKRHQVYGFHQPRDLKYGVINGQGYILTANTGAIKEFRLATEGFEFTDAGRARVLNTGGLIDQALVGAANLAKINSDTELGRLHISKFDGLNNQQNLVQYLHTYGGRSISMFNSATFTRVYDTGDDMERYVAAQYPTTFNGECSNANLSPANEADLRSDDYGVEPTAIDVGSFNGSPVLVAGARTGQLFMYSVIGTALTYQSVHRRGTDSQIWNTLYTNNQAGDAIISDIGYLDETTSPSRTPLVYVIGSGTSSIGLYEIYDDGNTKL